MISETFQNVVVSQLASIRNSGLHKEEHPISSPQDVHVSLGSQKMLNFCANNYLGLSNSPALITAAKEALDHYGYGMSSVRFICGTQVIHQQLESAIAAFFGFEDALLYGSCFDANGGLFETLLDESDVIISDMLNHASIIDGIRLCKANRFRYHNNDMADLEAKLIETKSARTRLIVTDGVFSMNGTFADLKNICRLAKQYEALVVVDDSHATGFVGNSGRGTAELFGVEGDVDIVTSTFGKALGGAAGGFVAATTKIIALLRQRSRPYLFSNSMPPALVAANHQALTLVQEADDLRKKLHENTRYFRSQIKTLGFDIIPGDHPIVPVMGYDAHKAKTMAQKLFDMGIYVVAFGYPVVPMNQARIRVQISAAHSRQDLDTALHAFASLGS